MLGWWKRKKRPRQSTSITPRVRNSARSRVDLGSLAPPLADYLASGVSIQLAMFSKISELSGQASKPSDAGDLAFAAGVSLDRFRSLRNLLEDYVDDVPSALAGPRRRLMKHLENIESSVWLENLGTAYVVGGFTRDFWHRLANGFQPEITRELQQIFEDSGENELLAKVVRNSLSEDPSDRARLSLWSRRLVGDTILICRDGLSSQGLESADAEVRLEPVLTDVLGLHTGRLEQINIAA